MRAAERQPFRVHSRSPEETEELGAALGASAFPGAVLLLEGPLGAGKTALARGVGRGLEVTGAVTSPTFTILAVHEGRLPFFHVDLYRVETPADLRAIDLAEVFDSGGVAAVEWPRWLLRAPPRGTLEVRIDCPAAGERALALSSRDARWVPALAALARAPASRARRSPA